MWVIIQNFQFNLFMPFFFLLRKILLFILREMNHSFKKIRSWKDVSVDCASMGVMFGYPVLTSYYFCLYWQCISITDFNSSHLPLLLSFFFQKCKWILGSSLSPMSHDVYVQPLLLIFKLKSICSIWESLSECVR